MLRKRLKIPTIYEYEFRKIRKSRVLYNCQYHHIKVETDHLRREELLDNK